MRIEDLEAEAKNAVEKFTSLKRIEVVDKHRGAIKLRLYIEENFYIQAYCNTVTKTTNFVAIVGGQRIFGRDGNRSGAGGVMEGVWCREFL